MGKPTEKYVYSEYSGFTGSEPALYIEKYRSELKDQNSYAAELRKLLPAFVFKPVPQRLWWLAVHMVIIITSVVLIHFADDWYFDFVLALLIGHSLGCNFFLGHEIAHGSVLKNKRMIVFFSTLCFFQWGLHGRAWIAWHNRKHHHTTNHPYKDPDCFGKKYTRFKMMVSIQQALPGSRTAISYLFLTWFFSFFAFNIVWFMPRIFTAKRDRIVSRVFSGVVYLLWIPLSIFAEPFGFIYLFLIPVLVSNLVIMSYIATNHFLNPLTEEKNDPLANSLSVQTNKFLDFIHLNFSYHIEHHILPYVNPKYAPIVAEVLRSRYPEKYKMMPHAKALRLLYQRPRFYKDDVTLINLKNGEVHPTIILDEFIDH